MTTKTVYTKTLQYAKRIRIVADRYTDGSLYIGLYTMSGEPYADISTNVLSVPFPFFHVEIGSEAEAFVKEQNLGTDLKLIHGTSWKEYKLYELTI